MIGMADTKRSHRCSAFWKSPRFRTHCRQETGESGRGLNGWSGLFSSRCFRGTSVKYTLYPSFDLAKATCLSHWAVRVASITVGFWAVTVPCFFSTSPSKVKSRAQPQTPPSRAVGGSSLARSRRHFAQGQRNREFTAGGESALAGCKADAPIRSPISEVRNRWISRPDSQTGSLAASKPKPAGGKALPIHPSAAKIKLWSSPCIP